MNKQNPLSAKNALELFAICSTIYIIFAIGRVLPYDSEDAIKSAVGGIIFLLFISYITTTTTTHRITATALTFTCISTIILALGTISSEHPGYVFDKFQGGIISSSAVFFAMANCYRKYGIHQTHKTIILCALSILALTALYKLSTGFFDRNIRFLINGPIVFGWIAGMFCIMSLQLHATTTIKSYKLAGYLFLAAVLWTQSKGPILALSITLIYSFATSILRNPLKTIGIISLLTAAVIGNIDSINDILSDTRLAVITRVATGELEDSDEGSIGTRSELFDHAISKIQTHPFGGIGLGQFEHLGFKYPHNQHLEIATELGIPAAALHLIFIGISFLLSQKIFRAFIIFFFVAGMFSGDISYLRFLYTFALLGLISTNIPWQAPSSQKISRSDT